MELLQIEKVGTPVPATPQVRRLPPWLRAKAGHWERVHEMKVLLGGSRLHTVCEEARCPNQGECWTRGTATFMLLGDTCTRSCGFCAVTTGRPGPPDPEEPRHVAEVSRRLGLSFVVVTSVARDDLKDGGAAQFAATVRAIHELNPVAQVEVLVPDFKTNRESIRTVVESQPTVFNHNLETVERLSKQVRVQARYHRSLDVLRIAKEMGQPVTKTGIMLGLGETEAEVLTLMRDARAAGCDILTIGQYLQPTKQHLPVVEFVHPDRFKALEEAGYTLGFKAVYSGPLVRSSYHAELSARRVTEVAA
ncbi:MAG: lipoyl synthase [candidate division NC10 bacterium]|nr:lipoyl synthase [candidate division NC10 bacterium]